MYTLIPIALFYIVVAFYLEYQNAKDNN